MWQLALDRIQFHSTKTQETRNKKKQLEFASLSGARSCVCSLLFSILISCATLRMHIGSKNSLYFPPGVYVTHTPKTTQDTPVLTERHIYLEVRVLVAKDYINCLRHNQHE